VIPRAFPEIFGVLVVVTQREISDFCQVFRIQFHVRSGSHTRPACIAGQLGVEVLRHPAQLGATIVLAVEPTGKVSAKQELSTLSERAQQTLGEAVCGGSDAPT
jgi:hypothetical protein